MATIATTKPFRPIPLTAITEDEQLIRIENEIEKVRMQHAVKMGRQAIYRIRNNWMLPFPVVIEDYLRRENVWHDKNFSED